MGRRFLAGVRKSAAVYHPVDHYKLHEFFIALFVHIRVFSCFKFVQLDYQYFEPCLKSLTTKNTKKHKEKGELRDPLCTLWLKESDNETSP